MVDTCPTISQKYEVNTTRETMRQVLIKRIQSAGYTINVDSAGDINAKKKDFYLWTRMSPETGTGTSDYASSKALQNQHVDTLDINIQLYN